MSNGGVGHPLAERIEHQVLEGSEFALHDSYISHLRSPSLMLLEQTLAGVMALKHEGITETKSLKLTI